MTRTWLIPFFVFLIPFIFYIYLQRTHPLIGEEFMLLLEGERVLNGELPYRDFFQFLTPGSIYLSALLFKIFGVKLSVIKIFIAIVGSLLVLLTYFLSARIIDRPLITIVPPVLVMYYSIPFVPLFYHHWNAEIFILIFILSGLKYLATRNLIYIFFCGITSCIVFWFIQHKGILIFFAGVAFLLFDIEKKDTILNPISAFISGFFITFIPYFIYLYLNGAHTKFIYDCFVWVKNYYAPFNSLPEFLYLEKKTFQYYLNTSDVLQALIKTRNPFFIGYLPMFIILTGIIYLAKNLKKDLFFLQVTIIFLFLSVFSRPDFVNILYISQPLFVLLIYYLNELLLKTKYRITRLAAMFFIIILVLNTLHGMLGSINEATKYRYPLNTDRGIIYFKSNEEAHNYSDLFNYIDSTLKRERVFILNFSTFLYFLSGTRNYTSYDEIIPGYNTEGQLDDLIEQLRTKRINYILYDSLDHLIKQHGPKSMYPEGYIKINLKNKLSHYINTNYRILNQIAGIKILRSTLSPLK